MLLIVAARACRRFGRSWLITSRVKKKACAVFLRGKHASDSSTLRGAGSNRAQLKDFKFVPALSHAWRMTSGTGRPD